MAPNDVSGPTGVLSENESEVNTDANLQERKLDPHPGKIVWKNTIMMFYLHVSSLYSIYLVFTSAKILTTLWAYFLFACGGFGITAGAHRLWAHRSYKAKWPLRFILAVFQTMAFQNDIYEWSRDHRVHHKYSETDADPHNAKRGFFFSHVGWLLVKKHPEVIKQGQKMDFNDLLADPIVYYQKKYYKVLMPLLCFVVPTIIPCYFWGESLWNAWFVAALLKYCANLNITWLVNSAAHMWGNKPYDKNINPAENMFVAISAIGEGWHNYHHTFPWDYKTAELGNYRINVTTALLNFFAKIGWAYDMKTVNKAMIEKRARRTGDGSHPLWGWGDKDFESDACNKISGRKTGEEVMNIEAEEDSEKEE